MPEKPDVGRPYFRVACKFDALNLLQVADGGSNLLRWRRRRESNPSRKPDKNLEFRAVYPFGGFIPAVHRVSMKTSGHDCVGRGSGTLREPVVSS
jgi:hypothetical protein